MEYRKAIPSDIDSLVSLRIDMLCEENLLSEKQKDSIRRNTKQFLNDGFSDQSVVVWIAVDSQRIICMGCMNYFLLPPNDWCPSGKTAYIGSMFTVPSFRSKGIASNILTYLIDEARLNQCQRISLHSTNMGKPLYEKYGFGESVNAMTCYPFGILP